MPLPRGALLLSRSGTGATLRLHLRPLHLRPLFSLGTAALRVYPRVGSRAELGEGLGCGRSALLRRGACDTSVSVTRRAALDPDCGAAVVGRSLEQRQVVAHAYQRPAVAGQRNDRAGFGGDRFRTAIARACTAAAVPAFSPHDLRHRRISLLHLSGVPWARIGEHVGQRSLRVTADTYSHVLVDESELDYSALLTTRLT
jgi:hypothetical protein